jgi:hypothetical protein
MVDVIATILILYLLYKLVFDFIVPVSRTTSHFKHHVNEMRRQQEEQAKRQDTFSQNKTPEAKPASNEKNTTTTDSEYIDFEDVK